MCISSANDAKSLELFKSSLRYQKVKMVNIILEIFCVSTLERSIHFHLAFLSSSTFLKVEKKKKMMIIIMNDHIVIPYQTIFSLRKMQLRLNELVWWDNISLINKIIAKTKKYLQSDWLRGVQYWPYLYSVFNICILLLYKKNQHSISVAGK